MAAHKEKRTRTDDNESRFAVPVRRSDGKPMRGALQYVRSVYSVTIWTVRYLVTAKVRSGNEEAFDTATDNPTLGKGSVQEEQSFGRPKK